MLGICVGMQMLTLGSEEGKLPGLGLIRAHTRRFPGIDGLRIPAYGLGHREMVGSRASARARTRATVAASTSYTHFASSANHRRIRWPPASMAANSPLQSSATTSAACSSTRKRATASVCSFWVISPHHEFAAPAGSFPAFRLPDGELLKTRRFKDPTYLGDPINAVKIFNDLECDELIVVDIRATLETIASPTTP